MKSNEKESDYTIDLLNYFNFFWKKKWYIFIPTFLVTLILGIIYFVRTPVYEIDTLVQPGKFYYENSNGNIFELIIEEPEQIADKVNHSTFDSMIASELNISLSSLPEIKAEPIQETNLVRIWIKHSDIELGKTILEKVNLYLRNNIDKKVEVELDNITSDIERRTIEKENFSKQLELTKNKINIIGKRKKDILEEMNKVKERINDLDQERKNAIQRQNKNEVETLGLLLYSNEILENLHLYDSLNEKYSQIGLDEEEAKAELQELQSRINTIEATIRNLHQRKDLVDKTQVVKSPTSNLEPVSPKIISIVMSFFLTFFICTLVIVILEIFKQRNLER